MVRPELNLCHDFAALLRYPDVDLKPAAARCARRLQASDPQAAAVFAGFIDFLEQQGLARIEEVYTATFDLQALCQPYVGYHLCGENQVRTLFMMKLKEIYRQQDFTLSDELPDHLGVLLRFVAVSHDVAGCREIVGEALLPALRKMLAGFDDEAQPYRRLLNALQLYLENALETEPSESHGEKELSHG